MRGATRFALWISLFAVLSVGRAVAADEVVVEVRVQGNTQLPDEEIVRLAGITVGQRLDDDSFAQIESRVRSSGRFESVEIRKRYRSLEDFSQIALILVVHEKPASDKTVVYRPIRRILTQKMFLPIFRYDDGYGLTYGMRTTFVNPLGTGERLSVPLTWGGAKRAALESEWDFKGGPLTRVRSSVGILSRNNPHFLLADRRKQIEARLERKIHIVRLGVESEHDNVRFGSLNEGLWTLGANAEIDTRNDPTYPSNAVYALTGWRTMNVTGRSGIGIVQTDLRGYLRVVRQAVVAARIKFEGANAPLPDYEKLLVGGASTLRGARAGALVGDRELIASTELRVPITSPIGFGKFGATVFLDAAKVVDFGTSLRDVSWSRGAGAGVFMAVTFVQLNVNLAHSLDGRGNRLYVSMGFTF